MGRLRISGPKALSLLEYLTTNQVSKLDIHQVQYSLMCNQEGGIIDDLTLYRLAEDDFLLCVNSCNREKDLGWIRKHLSDGVEVADLTDNLAQIAIQGPRAEQVLVEILGEKIRDLEYFRSANFVLDSYNILVSRTGYTGEDGFEIYLPRDKIEQFWIQVLSMGQEVGLRPIGLGARDTLRTEMCYCLYGNDISEQTTPLEAGLGWLIGWDKGDFVGRRSLEQQLHSGISKRLVGFQLLDKGVPRTRYPIYMGERLIGSVTSGILSPSLGKGIGMAYVEPEYSKIGTTFELLIRNRRIRAEVVKTPFYPSKVKRTKKERR